jgi:two-component system sensor histidine kinase UhpB
VLIANGVLVAFGAVLGTWFAVRFVADAAGPPHLEWAAALAALATLVSVAINFAVLKAALQPLEVLNRVVGEVRQGNLEVRVPDVLFTDPVLDDLNETLNEILDALQAHRAHLQALSAQVLQAQEDERKRIARELHDETAQVLTTLLIGLKMLARARSQAELQARLSEMRELTAHALEAVRDMALELRPSTLDDLGLVDALESYAETYASRLGLPVHFEAEGFDQRLSAQIELALYRVVQEAMTNVARHASAREVWVVLRHAGDEVSASVRDDGAGFEPEEVMKSKEAGLGLFGMRERMSLVGGDLTIQSAPGSGTSVLARVRLEGAGLQP